MNSELESRHNKNCPKHKKNHKKCQTLYRNAQKYHQKWEWITRIMIGKPQREKRLWWKWRRRKKQSFTVIITSVGAGDGSNEFWALSLEPLHNFLISHFWRGACWSFAVESKEKLSLNWKSWKCQNICKNFDFYNFLIIESPSILN